MTVMITPDLWRPSAERPSGQSESTIWVRPQSVGKMLEIQLDERRSNLRIREADGIERDVEAACLINHGP